MKRKRQLECSCCGGDAGRFEQHPNRDTGYGVCRRCIDWMLGRGTTAEEILRNFGNEGVNYQAPAEPTNLLTKTKDNP
ncbi:hypothetical protein LP414_27585 [Polaromonas sp. P1(28)-13]|nr:hypothetical protein LP414_27585 [Polaromonas sp. P1(28)-13]